MNQKIFFFLFFCLPAINLSADKIYFTVIAKSGLSIRAEKSLSSERLAVVPFGEKVLPKTIFWEDKITVEEIEGFWISVEFGEVEGFMFSGFLFPGEIDELTFESRKEDCVFLDKDFDQNYFDKPRCGRNTTFSFEFYNPKRIWYGVKFGKDTTTFTLVEFEFNFDYKKNQAIYFRSRSGFESGNFYTSRFYKSILLFQVKSERDFDFFVETIEKMTDKIESKYFFNVEKRKSEFMFLDENENIEFELYNKMWNLKSHVYNNPQTYFRVFVDVRMAAKRSEKNCRDI